MQRRQFITGGLVAMGAISLPRLDCEHFSRFRSTHFGSQKHNRPTQ